MTPHYYDVTVKWSNNRLGVLSSEELDKVVEVATPPEFSKGMPGVWSPEHLFTAAVNSCLMTTFLAIAESSKLEFTDFTSKALGKLELVEGKYIMSEVIMKPMLTVSKSADVDKAFRILHKSEAACLITQSIKSRITFQPTVKVAG